MLTDDQRAVLAHVVLDPDAWVDHVAAIFEPAAAAHALEEKVAQWRPDYEAALAEAAAAGRPYLTRAERAPHRL